MEIILVAISMYGTLLCASLVILFLLFLGIYKLFFGYTSEEKKHKHAWKETDWNVDPIGVRTELGVFTTNYECESCPETKTTKSSGFI